MEEKTRRKGRKAIESFFHPSSPITAAVIGYSKYCIFLSSEVYTSLSLLSFHCKLRNELMIARFRLMEAVEQSKICILIFFPDYAYSRRHLDEVAKVNECRRTSGQIVLPIFCDIKPSDVQNQTGPFEKPFRCYQWCGVDKKVIKKWKEALREMGSLEGYTISYPHYEGHAVREIVDQVEKLSAAEVSLDDDLVGMEQSYWSVVKMLYNTSETRNVQVVGICGMPGIGKTALARAVYRRLRRFYKGCSFVSSIQERSGKDGLPSLQVQLIKELLNTNDICLGSFDDNLQFIKCRFSKTRVLIVLDSVECLDHIEAFGVDTQCFSPGSKIILTTRKPELLVKAKVPHRYFLEELDELHALKLFYKHTFQKDSPEEEYCHLSAEIASSTRGIPSVIESVGSYLSNYRNEEKEKWEEVLQQLRSCQYEPLKELLRLSRDILSKGRWHFYPDKVSFHEGKRDDVSQYDAVLCFDARDRVKNLVESLHKRMKSFGIGIFALNGDYKRVNETGKIFIPVISRSYASNSSCLEMLVHMVECRRSSATNLILPIYHAIEPSDVRLETPLYESGSGWSLPETFTVEEFDDLIKSVCQMALEKLKLNLSKENHWPGIDEDMERILNLLNLEVNDVRSVTIRGENGTGKTTLAKFVYHRLSSSFEGCSFLAEIYERTQHPDGIKYLQAKLLSDLLNKEYEPFTSVAEGINLIKERFQHVKVLIILDDVAESSHVEDLVGQLNWFGLGSRIIITAHIYTGIPLPHSNYLILDTWHWHSYKAREILNMHAFRKGDPVRKFRSLSRRMAAKLCEFPNSCLALEVVGSLLYGKDEKEWKNMLLDLGDIDLRKILRMSYGRLSETEKQIFLDIACLPIGMDRRIAWYLWCDSLHSPSSTYNDLEALIILSSLVKVDANEEIWMHRLVKNFGREIIDQENEQVKREGETKPVQSEVPAAHGYERMANVRFFKLDHANITESINRVLMRQRGIIWECWPLDLLATLHSDCLKVLDMSWSKVTEDWEGWHQIKVPQLRVLNLRGCSDLVLTPVFSFCPKLEMLILEHCSRLVKIDPSICKLQCLSILNLRYCLELCTLPEELGYLTALKELPLDGTSVREIPVSIGHLTNLNCVTAIDCLSLRHLPSSTCHLRFVTVIKLDSTKITELPYLIGKLKLQHLSLRGCRGIKRLVSLVGEVENSLIELDVSKTSISELPKSIIKLKALRVLKMDFCFVTEFPLHFGELKLLEEIHASWCRSLENLPDDIGELESLRMVKVVQSRISSIPYSIKSLEHLETLDCTSCYNLQNLPELPNSLIYLYLESKKLIELPDVSNFKRLEVFTLVVDISYVSMIMTAWKNDPFRWPAWLRTLELCIPNIITLPDFCSPLRKLCLRCTGLEHIRLLPPELVSLSLQDCNTLKSIPHLGHLRVLEEMEILRCPRVKEINGLEKLENLKILTISSSGIVSLDGLDKLTSLTRLSLSDCPEMKKIEGLEKLQALVSLTISSSSIVSLSGLDKLASLKSLTLSYCLELEHIEGLAKLQALEVLAISSCGIVSLTGLDKLTSLEKLTLSDCGSLSEFPNLSTLEGVDVFIPEDSY